MFRKLRQFFFPHPENNHHPLVFRELSLLILTLIVLTTFFSQLTYSLFIPRDRMLSAIYTQSLAQLTNADREKDNLPPLAWNTTLADAAQKKANDMALKGYFAHTSPDGVTPWHWFGVVGYRFAHAGENLAVNFSDTAEVEQAWMNSPAHRANILEGKYSEIGIGTAPGIYKGNSVIFVVQLFGTRIQDMPTEGTNGAGTTPPTIERVIPKRITEKLPVRQVSKREQAPVQIAPPKEAPSPQSPPSAQVLGSSSPTLQPTVALASLPIESEKTPPIPFISYIYLSIASLLFLGILLSAFSRHSHHHLPHFILSGLLLVLILLLVALSQGRLMIPS